MFCKHAHSEHLPVSHAARSWQAADPLRRVYFSGSLLCEMPFVRRKAAGICVCMHVRAFVCTKAVQDKSEQPVKDSPVSPGKKRLK